MTKFSPEYIAYILSDEAKVLQERWKPKYLDWVDMMGLGILERGPIEDGETWIARSWKVRAIADFKIHWCSDVTWLPTLTDLLDMIEEHVEGWSMSHSKDYPKDFAYQYSTEYGVIEINGSDNLLLAAATLAVRVLEGKE